MHWLHGRSHRPGRRRLRLAALVAVATIGATAIVAPAAKATVGTPAWWNGDCDVTNHPGSYALGASYNGVKACGVTAGGNNLFTVHFFSGAFGENEWQCVELVMRYMYQVYGIAPYSANGKDVVANYPGTSLVKVANNGTTLPQPGDILSYAASSDTDPTYGHTSVVTGVSVNANGNGAVTVMQQNASANGVGTVTVTANKLGMHVSGWLHNPVGAPSGGSGGYRSGSDTDKNLGSDLVVTTNQPGGGSAANVALSTYVGFIPPAQWWADPTTGWAGITPLVGDVNGDGKADYVLVANNGSGGTRAYVALSTGSGFGVPQLWWDGSAYGYSGIKPSLGDVDGNGGADLVLTTNQPGGGSAAIVLLSTYIGFLAPQQWWADPTTGWSGITPLVSDLNGDHKADYVFLADAGAAGTRAYVGLSTGTGFSGPALWWNGTGYGYSGIKPSLGDVDHNGGADLVLTTNQPGGGSAAIVLLSTYVGFLAPVQWWADPTTGWSGITPLVGDLNGDGKADYVFVADAGTGGTRAYAGLSTGSAFGGPTLWWNGSTYGYSGIKASLS